MEQLYRVLLKPARCAVDLGNGSERGLYVNQDYILQRLGRPHRAINLMYCYYPLDKEWPARISEVMKPATTGDAWGYSYDDYFPFVGDAPFAQMADIRRHGQDVILTLTCDPAVTDDMITAIAEKLRPYGRIMLRLNHECTGSWFAYNKRCTYQEVADFFVRFCRVLRKTAPNVQVILCAGSIDGEKLEKEEEFTEAARTADIWSLDQYLSLNWGWPNEVAEKDNFNHKTSNVRGIFDLLHRSYDRYCVVNGGQGKPMQVAEFNDDGDVLGPVAQARRVREFYDLIEREGDGWLTGLTMYQFRDDGRLGLEITDPNNPEVGIPQPLLGTYREIIHRPYFTPAMEAQPLENAAMPLRWGGAEDAEGIGMEVRLEREPVFCEAVFENVLKDMNLMLCFRGRWFAKKPGVDRVDLLSSFWEKPMDGPETTMLTLFAPPADGKNPVTDQPDWDVNYRAVLPSLPAMRIRYEGCMTEV